MTHNQYLHNRELLRQNGMYALQWIEAHDPLQADQMRRIFKPPQGRTCGTAGLFNLFQNSLHTFQEENMKLTKRNPVSAVDLLNRAMDRAKRLDSATELLNRDLELLGLTLLDVKPVSDTRFALLSLALGK